MLLLLLSRFSRVRLCNPIDGSPPGSPVPGVLQARTLEWVAISFSNAWKWKVKSESEVTQSCLTLRNPMDCSLPGSSVHGIFQARVLAGVGCHCLLRCSTIILAKNNKVMFCKCRRKITYNFIPSYTMSDYKTFPGRQRLRIYYPQMLYTHTHTHTFQS